MHIDSCPNKLSRLPVLSTEPVPGQCLTIPINDTEIQCLLMAEVSFCKYFPRCPPTLRKYNTCKEVVIGGRAAYHSTFDITATVELNRTLFYCFPRFRQPTNPMYFLYVYSKSIIYIIVICSITLIIFILHRHACIL